MRAVLNYSIKPKGKDVENSDKYQDLSSTQFTILCVSCCPKLGWHEKQQKVPACVKSSAWDLMLLSLPSGLIRCGAQYESLPFPSSKLVELA